MPEVPIWVVGVAMLLTVVGGSLLGQIIMRMDGRSRPIDGAEGIPLDQIDLNKPMMQGMLQALLDKYGIHGSCQIVDGRVMRREVDGDRTGLANAIRQAVERASYIADGNTNLAIYTYRDSKGMIPVGQLSLDDLLGLAAMLETARVDGMRDGVAAAKHAQRLAGEGA